MKKTFFELNQNIGNLVNCKALHAAVTKKSSGFKTFDKRDKSIDNTQWGILGNLSSKCKMISLYDIKRMYKLNTIDVLKIDIEGGEYSLIPSIKHILKTDKPDIFLSLHPEFPYSTNKKRGLMKKLVVRLKIISNHIRLYWVLRHYKYCFDRELNSVSLFILITQAFYKKHKNRNRYYEEILISNTK